MIRIKRHFARRTLLSVAALAIFSCAQPLQQENLYGVWKGETQGVELVFRFYDDGRCDFSFKNLTNGGFDRISGRFETDFTKQPVPLTVRGIPQLNHPLHTIIEFIRADSIRIAHFAPRWRLRPVGFGNETSFYLKKVDRNPSAQL